VWVIPVAVTYIILGYKAKAMLNEIEEELERWEGKRSYH
jgi:hypothetical protein